MGRYGKRGGACPYTRSTDHSPHSGPHLHGRKARDDEEGHATLLAPLVHVRRRLAVKPAGARGGAAREDGASTQG